MNSRSRKHDNSFRMSAAAKSLYHSMPMTFAERQRYEAAAERARIWQRRITIAALCLMFGIAWLVLPAIVDHYGVSF